jgi:hypothetical protein
VRLRESFQLLPQNLHVTEFMCGRAANPSTAKSAVYRR